LKKKFEDTKGAIRAINRRRTHNAMTKRKSIKEQTTIYKILQRKKNRETRTSLKTCSTRLKTCLISHFTHFHFRLSSDL